MGKSVTARTKQPREVPDARAIQALAAIRAGAPDEDAAAFAGIEPTVFRRWMRGAFAKDVSKARADLAVFAAGVVRQAANHDPGVAQRLADRSAGKHELERLKVISGVTR